MTGISNVVAAVFCAAGAQERIFDLPAPNR